MKNLYTKTMPNPCTRLTVWLLIFFSLSSMPGLTLSATASGDLTRYYTRYDVKYSKNQLINDHLLMVPAKNEFRAEIFSQLVTKGVISAGSDTSETAVNQKIQENSIKTVLVNHGLTSVTTKDYETVVSYEGVVVTPLKIAQKTYDAGQNTWTYEVWVRFGPIAFPDRWDALRIKQTVKNMLNEFFQLFQ